MSIYEDFERDSADAAKYVNEDGLVISRYGPQPKKTWLYLQREFEKAIPFTPVGEFATGFTYESTNQTGIDGNGEYWIYNGTVPFTVAPGTVPSEPDYTKVIFNSHSNLVDTDAENSHPASAIQTDSGVSVEDFLSSLSKNKPQYSVVDSLKSSQTPTEMYARCDGTTLHVGVMFGSPYHLPNDSGDNQTAVEWRFIRNADGLLLMRGCNSGYIDVDIQSNEVTLNGTFTTGSGISYTTTQGDSFTGTFQGRSFIFNHYRDDRGGVWKVTVNNENEQRVGYISTYWAGAAGVHKTILFTDMDENTTYNFTAEFIGDDPNYEPSGGAGTSRGWISYTAGVSTNKPVSGYLFNGLSSQKTISATSSINDFAVSAKLDGAAYASDWVPVHANADVSQNVTSRLTVNDDRYDITSSLPVIERVAIDNLKIESKFNATNWNEPSVFLWDHYITHSFDDGVMTIKNNLYFTNDTFISSGYLALVGADITYLDNIRYTTGDNYATQSVNDSFNVKDGVRGVIYEGYFDSGVGHALCAESDIYSSCNLGSDFEADNCMLQTFRTDDVNKTYWICAEGSTIPSGSRMESVTRHYAINGIRFPNNINE